MIDLRERMPDEPEEFKESISDDASPKVQRAHKRLTEARKRIREIIEKGEFPQSDDFRSLWSDYKHCFFQAQFSGKCAYCETRFGAGYSGDVEHYRPKTKIREPKRPGNRDDISGQPPGRRFHEGSKPGYWWLAYSWDNYLCSCKRCNNWKLESFPLRNERTEMVPGAEAGEQPLLINPYLTDPALHLTFNQLGEIFGVTEEGQITIDRCGLNRESLNHERKARADELKEAIDDYLSAFESRNDALVRSAIRRLKAFRKGAAPYAAMARAIIEERLPPA